jgi:hypothetical protein
MPFLSAEKLEDICYRVHLKTPVYGGEVSRLSSKHAWSDHHRLACVLTAAYVCNHGRLMNDLPSPALLLDHRHPLLVVPGRCACRGSCC